MVRVLLYIFAVSCFISCQQKTTSDKKTEKFDEATHAIVNNPLSANGRKKDNQARLEVVGSKAHDFGEIMAGTIISHRFVIKNVGDREMVIIDEDASCGCTVPSYKEGPILPGDTTSILVKYDSKGKKGSQDKKVSIFTNTVPNETVFTIRGTVIN